METTQLYFIKLGGSVITDKKINSLAHEDVISRLAREIKLALPKTGAKLFLGHGSGSFGHFAATKFPTQPSQISAAVIKLNRIVITNFLEQKIPVIPFAPSSFISAKNQKLVKVFLDPIVQALESNQIPVVFGDIILDQTLGHCIFSTEKTLGIVAEKLKNKFGKISMIYCGDTNGVYDKNKKTIPFITQENLFQYKKDISGSAGVDVTGGMINKIEECLSVAAKLHITTLLINGNTPGELKRALLGQKVSGTLIA